MNEDVERCELAPGLTMSRVLTGLWQVADMERDGGELDWNRAADSMVPYAEAGFTTFDMADHYGSAEDISGSFRDRHEIASRTQLFTKWVPAPGRITRQDARAAVERSLERMHVDRLDLLQFHAWTFSDPSWLDCLYWLQELKEEGLIRNLGLTNFDTAHLRIAVTSGIEVVSNQVCFSLLDRRPKSRMAQLCQQHGIKILAYGTLAGGFLTERWFGEPEPDRLTTWSQMKYRRFVEEAGGWNALQALLGTVDEVARRHGVSMANVATRYILDQPAVGGVIVGARLGKSEHIRDTQRLFRFSLDSTSRDMLDEAVGRLRRLPGDSGDEYRKAPYLTASGDLSHHVEAFPPPFDVSTGRSGRRFATSGTEWEEMAGFCRAVRHGDRVLVSGTTATHGDRVIGGTDAAAQAHFAIDKIGGALRSLGAQLEDVVRTRVYVRRLEDWEAVARAHGERFREILPVNTLVQAGLVGDDYLVEVEAEAVVSERASELRESQSPAPF
ncbi:MAG: aldo/keto reductase [Trueperaceae bacterium]